jgi:uncharacterized protein YkwD
MSLRGWLAWLLLPAATASSYGAETHAFTPILHAACPAAGQIELSPRAALDRAAAAMAEGASLDDALAHSRYRQHTSMAARITGKAAAPERIKRTARLLFERYCENIVADDYRDFGLHRSDGSLTVILARPRRDITADEIPQLRARLLLLVNEARAVGRQCGSDYYAAAPPVRYSDALTRVAVLHVTDMAQRRQLGHAGSDGSSPSERVARIGYEWSLVGENLALGYDDVEALVEGWLVSPDHCSNIMDGRFLDMGVAFAPGSESDAPLYWAQSFAAPRRAKLTQAAARR